MKAVTVRIRHLTDELFDLAQERAHIVRQLQAEGWTYQQLADQLGVSRSIIDKIAQRAEPIHASPRAVRQRTD